LLLFVNSRIDRILDLLASSFVLFRTFSTSDVRPSLSGRECRQRNGCKSCAWTEEIDPTENTRAALTRLLFTLSFILTGSGNGLFRVQAHPNESRVTSQSSSSINKTRVEVQAPRSCYSPAKIALNVVFSSFLPVYFIDTLSLSLPVVLIIFSKLRNNVST
jgi:hypothetical protein